MGWSHPQYLPVLLPSVVPSLKPELHSQGCMPSVVLCRWPLTGNSQDYSRIIAPPQLTHSTATGSGNSLLPGEVPGHSHLNRNVDQPTELCILGTAPTPDDQDCDHAFEQWTHILQQSSLLVESTGGDIFLIHRW